MRASRTCYKAKGCSGLSAAVLAIVLTGCRLGPDYRPPAAPGASAYTAADAGIDGQNNTIARADWWKLFCDPQLDEFESQAEVANRDIKVAVARVDEARAVIGTVRYALFPTITAQPQISRSREARDRPNNGNTNGKAATYNDIQIPLVMSWEIDLWGRVRRTVEAARASEQVSEADLRFIRLTTEAAVAMGYYQLRETDQEIAVVENTIRDLQEAVDITQLRFQHGLSGDLEVAQAKALLEQTIASEPPLKTQRDQLQHQLAVLLGRTPEGFVLPTLAANSEPPTVPVGLPSDLLQRRPDIAAADRNVAAATARIGIAKAAYFPQLSLTGAVGYESTNPATLINWQNSISSLAASVVAPIFTGGRLRAGVRQAQAQFRQSILQYEKTVLVSYQEVEDQLTALHNLATQAQLQNLALQDASRAEQIAMERYKRGLVAYLDVVNAEQNVLFNERTITQISGQRLTASVALVKALGGGWEASQTPYAAKTAQSSEN
jgi:multidrug efflux system outer membrane protein